MTDVNKTASVLLSVRSFLGNLLDERITNYSTSPNAQTFALKLAGVPEEELSESEIPTLLKLIADIDEVLPSGLVYRD